MKFTRILSLAVAAAAALSFTACDDDSSTAPDAAAEINKTSFTLGSQEQVALPSILSIRDNGIIMVADLDKAPARVEKIDVIMYEDFNTTSSKLDINQAKLWSPDAFATDAVMKFMKLSTDYILKNATAKARQTRFASIALDNLDDIKTRGDLDEIIKDISASQWQSTIIVETGDVIAINASGTYAIAKTTSVTAVDVKGTLPSTDNKAVNMNILVAQKI